MKNLFLKKLQNFTQILRTHHILHGSDEGGYVKRIKHFPHDQNYNVDHHQNANDSK